MGASAQMYRITKTCTGVADGAGNFHLNIASRNPVMLVVSSGRFPCGADLRCGLRLYRRDIGGVKFGSAASRLSH